MLRYGVMRVASAVLALAHGLAFLVVCLGTCLGAKDAHACCPEGQDFTITDDASTDCCHVTAGVCSTLTTSVATLAAAAWIPHSSHAPAPLARVVSVVDAATSPPLVLRI